jgi:predicted metalloprotease with PDZ domain
MPVWIPGSYMVREFAKNVEGFSAFTPEKVPVRFNKVRKNVWRVYNDTSRTMSVSYEYYAFELSVRTCFVDADYAYLNGAAVFMYTDNLKDKPSLINFAPVMGWNKISTGLKPFGSAVFSRVASNYDELADSPVVIGNQDEFTFDYNGIPHHIAMIGKAEYDREQIKNDLFKIVDEATRIFGENPLEDYTFFIFNSSAGGGGLEHHNSTSIIVSRNTYENPNSYKTFLSLAAHEYFHLWSVKRIRPLELGPFDYENEVYTHQLWFFEGITSYYDDYILYRAGIYSFSEYLDAVRSNIEKVVNTPADRIQSLTEASFDAWIKYYRQNENSKNSIISYYSKGAVLGMVLNIDIIDTTKGVASLDSVMRYLYTEHYKKLGRGLNDKELQSAFEIVANKNYDDFFGKYIYGTTPIPFEEYLNKAGLLLVRTDGKIRPSGYLGATFSQSGSRLLVSFVERGTAAWDQGLNVNDEILEVDGKEPMQVRDYLAEKLPGDQVTFKIIRSGIQREFTIVLGESTNQTFDLYKMNKLLPQQEMILNKMFPQN